MRRPFMFPPSSRFHDAAIVARPANGALTARDEQSVARR